MPLVLFGVDYRFARLRPTGAQEEKDRLFPNSVYAWGSNLTSAGTVPRDPADFTTNWLRFGARVPVSCPGCPGCPGCPVLSCPCIQPFHPSISSVHLIHPSHPSVSSINLIHPSHPSIHLIHPHHPSNLSDASNVEHGNEMGLDEAVWANFRCNMNK